MDRFRQLEYSYNGIGWVILWDPKKATHIGKLSTRGGGSVRERFYCSCCIDVEIRLFWKIFVKHLFYSRVADIFDQTCCQIDCYTLRDCKQATSDHCTSPPVECAMGRSLIVIPEVSHVAMYAVFNTVPAKAR